MQECFRNVLPRFACSFMTSLEVIKEVMNVPMDAIHAIARMNGISTADNHEMTISEEELQPFIDAFERKTRHYFLNSIRNSAQLTPQELHIFSNFCKTFKKENVTLDKVRSWNHIGKTKLRKYFVDRIKEKESSSKHRSLFEVLMGSGGIDAISDNGIFRGIELSNIVGRDVFGSPIDDSEYLDTKCRRDLAREIIDRINSSWQYHAGIGRIKEECSGYVLDLVRHIILSARYYVYVDDDDDHQIDTVSSNSQHELVINSTCRMAD